jgi:predicted CXXCH cytochrome family protein
MSKSALTKIAVAHAAAAVMFFLLWLGSGGRALAQQEVDTTAADTTAVEATAENHCITCHTEMDYMPEGFSENDIHNKHGLSCAGCHGGDPTSDDDEVAMSEESGFVGVPDRSEMTEFCAKCHSSIEIMRKFQPRIATDQADQYKTSVHGQRLAEGDDHVAVCTSCHTSHAILPAADARSTVHPFNVPSTCDHCHGDADYMADYPIPTDQYAKFVTSVHGKALLEQQDTGAPACNDCHGNHGATPPGIASIEQVCGHCHVNNASYFSESLMAEAFANQDLHGCEECHGNHGVKKTSDAMVGNHKGAVCVECHDAGDKGYKAAGEINTYLIDLVNEYEEAKQREQHVLDIGMNDEEIAFLLQEAHQTLIQARTLVHTFDPVSVRKKTKEGHEKIDEAVKLAAAEVKDYKVRRRGFGMATLFTTVVALALFLRIRKMESA